MIKCFFTLDWKKYEEQFEEDRESIPEKGSEVESKNGLKYEVLMITNRVWNNPETKKFEPCCVIRLKEKSQAV